MNINYDEVQKDANGQATEQHVASHHVHGVPGGAELTLCDKLIVYRTWNGTTPGAPRCPTCEARDC